MSSIFHGGDPRSLPGFVAKQSDIETGFTSNVSIFPVATIPPMHHTRSFITDGICVIVAVDRTSSNKTFRFFPNRCIVLPYIFTTHSLFKHILIHPILLQYPCKQRYKHVSQTQLCLMNDTLQCCTFRFLRNHHQKIQRTKKIYYMWYRIISL